MDMVEAFELIVRDLAIIMILATVMALVSHRLKQPMVIAYIIAGMIIGPHTPPFSLISETDTLEVFAEIGVMLLLFVVGMEFPIAKLKQVGGKASLLLAAQEAHIYRISNSPVQFFYQAAAKFTN
jgi:CPA2 family monovalent cation:H+ antiporter-2